MKKTCKLFMQIILKWLAQRITLKHRPYVIGVTGSVGKTSTTQAIAYALQDNFDVRVTAGNYNNEFGLPLTVIGAHSGGSSVLVWFRVFQQAYEAYFSDTYPEVLVLEYGIDRPGDMDYLTSVLPPHMAIVTGISNVHREYFDSLQAIAKEKGGLVESLKNSYVPKLEDLPICALISGDDQFAQSIARRTSKAVYTYGLQSGSDFCASHVTPNENDIINGLSFKAEVKDRSVPIRLKNIIGTHNIPSVLSALSVCELLKINIVEASARLTAYKLPPGRMRLLAGLNESMVIDDTYNASLRSTLGLVEAFDRFSGHRQVIILGDMLELGSAEKSAHKKVLQTVNESSINIVVLVGHRMNDALASLDTAKYSLGETLFALDTPEEAAEVSQQFAEPGTVFAIKGSQGMRLEMVSAALLSPDLNPQNELCRQSSTWLEKEYIQP